LARWLAEPPGLSVHTAGSVHGPQLRAAEQLAPPCSRIPPSR